MKTNVSEFSGKPGGLAVFSEQNALPTDAGWIFMSHCNRFSIEG